VAYRVIVWGTGFVGKMVIREILDHPDFELAAVIVNDPAKAGRDVGEIVGGAPIGLAATTDVDAALALPADAVAYYGPTAAKAAANIENMSRALRAGKNVVSTAMTPLVYPKACPPQMLAPLEAACREGGTTCFTTGIDPGFANDLFPLTLIGLCGRVDRVRIQEILDYSSYTGDYSPMGFDQPPEHRALLEQPAILIFAWGHTIHLMADALDVKLDEIDTVYEKWATPERIVYPLGAIEAGRCAAVRSEIRGFVGGEPRIVIEHCNRITSAAAPHWPRPRIAENDAYRVIVEGSPNIVQETTFRGARDGDPNSGGCLATGMRALLAIPAVCAAKPGLISALDLPLIPGRHNLR
jgi:4-hydroxy-tetrahydrodipicolinate reductase